MKTTTILFMILILNACNSEHINEKSNTLTTFSFSFESRINSNNYAVFDTLTGNVKPWWDHTFSKDPKILYIDSHPGGSFMEIFDDKGNGVRHAVITASERGKLLRMEGPLGLAGHAILLVTTIELKSIDKNTTLLTLSVHASGEIKPDWTAVVEKVWRHFINERLKPYIEGTLIKQNS